MKLTINLKHGSQCVRYTSRLIWQLLFNRYKELNCDLTNMDSLLCDLYTLERCIETLDEFTLYWYCQNHYTDTIIDMPHPSYMSGLKVEYNRKLQQITYSNINSKS